jgi:integrase
VSPTGYAYIGVVFLAWCDAVLGWDIEEVSARLGHANVSTTQLIYVHAFDAARRSDDRRDRLGTLYPGRAVAG